MDISLNLPVPAPDNILELHWESFHMGSNKIIKICIFLIVLGIYPQISTAMEFDFSEGAVYQYQISIHISQDNLFTSANNVESDSGQLNMEADFLLYQTIEVLEDAADGYAKINCSFDSLNGRISSLSAEIPSTINIKVQRDSIEIRMADSLVGVYPPQTVADQVTLDYYERLLFIGEPIELAVYPTGEIININTNKNLWQQASDFIGLNGGSLLQITLPETSADKRWIQSVEIENLGLIKLKKPLEPLELTFNHKPELNRFAFAGLLEINNYIAPATITELDDEFQIAINNMILSRNGEAAYHGHEIIIDKMEFKTSLTGDILLNGKNNSNYQTSLNMNNINLIKYELIDSTKD